MSDGEVKKIKAPPRPITHDRLRGKSLSLMDKIHKKKGVQKAQEYKWNIQKDFRDRSCRRG